MESKEKGIGALKYPQLQLGFFAIFCYVGAEVTVGSFLTNYAGLPDIAGLSKQEATAFVALYWGSLMIGRFTGSLQAFNINETLKKVFAVIIPFVVFAFVRLVLWWKGIDVQHAYIYIIFIVISIVAFFLAQFKPARTMMLFPLFCIALLSIAILASGHLALWALVSVGLYNSVMWPCIFDLSIKGLGKHTSQGSSILVMGILGGALLPPLQGLVADSSLGLHLSFFVPIICYCYLFFFGYKVKQILIKQKVYDESALSSGH
jgi:FHS family L-fucose permease-like MFS transporter